MYKSRIKARIQQIILLHYINITRILSLKYIKLNMDLHTGGKIIHVKYMNKRTPTFEFTMTNHKADPLFTFLDIAQ